MKSCDCYVLLWSSWWIFDSCEIKSCDCCDSCKIVICVIMEFVMTGAVGRKEKKRKWEKKRKEKKRKEKETWYLQSDLGLVGRYQAVPGAWPVLLIGFRPGTNANSLAVPVLMRISSGYNGIFGGRPFSSSDRREWPMPISASWLVNDEGLIFFHNLKNKSPKTHKKIDKPSTKPILDVQSSRKSYHKSDSMKIPFSMRVKHWDLFCVL